jgi:hypothetical protein
MSDETRSVEKKRRFGITRLEERIAPGVIAGYTSGKKPKHKHKHKHVHKPKHKHFHKPKPY